MTDAEEECRYDPNLDVMGWYCGNATVTYSGCVDLTSYYDDGPSCAGTSPVAQKQANAWDLYDMHGSVHEWCNDWFESYPIYTGSAPAINPTGPDTGSARVDRGGSWAGGPEYCRSADRNGTSPDDKYNRLGFRVAFSDDYDLDGFTEEEGDCDDADDTVYPGATEVADDGKDQDCDGSDLTSINTFTNSLGMTFKLIPAGTFTMGSPEGDLGRGDSETQHQVTLTKPYYMQTTEVTQGQWKAVMGNNPSAFSGCGDNCPVDNVSWHDVQDFITELNKKRGGRIPPSGRGGMGICGKSRDRHVICKRGYDRDRLRI